MRLFGRINNILTVTEKTNILFPPFNLVKSNLMRLFGKADKNLSDSEKTNIVCPPFARKS